jgi:hypothetical protein
MDILLLPFHICICSDRREHASIASRCRRVMTVDVVNDDEEGVSANPDKDGGGTRG